MKPVAERKVTIINWTVEELENGQGYHFVSPEGYIFGFSTIQNAFDFIVSAAYGGTQHDTMYGDRHYVLVTEGTREIAVHEADSWINPGYDWTFGCPICSVGEITDIILKYVALKWTKNN